MAELPDYCGDSSAARRHLEERRWPGGPVCTHCQAPRKAYRLPGGLWKCAACRKKFNVALGTIFEDSRIPLHKWLLATNLMCATKQGLNAAELQRALGLRSYRSALFMIYRLAWALGQKPFVEALRRQPVSAPHR